ncbi:hypothetical protein PMIN06_005105 [Paraphaeosphaeria minitans]
MCSGRLRIAFWFLAWFRVSSASLAFGFVGALLILFIVIVFIIIFIFIFIFIFIIIVFIFIIITITTITTIITIITIIIIIVAKHPKRGRGGMHMTVAYAFARYVHQPHNHASVPPMPAPSGIHTSR